MFLARITSTVTAVGVVAALGLASLPASADQGRGRGGGARGERRDQPAAPVPRAAAPRTAVPRGGPPVASPVRPRRNAGPIVTPPGVQAQHRGGPYYPAPVYRGSYRGYPSARYYPRIPRFYGRPIRLAGPYYTFRPRVSIGFGLWVGFPVPFPAWAYAAPYPVPYPYPAYPGGYPSAYPYPVPYPAPYPPPAGNPGYPAQAPSSSVAVSPGAQGYGGVSLDITPADAEVYVDGGFAGRVGDFGPQAQPLTLAVGVHRIEVRAPGYRPLAFDVTISSGYVVPYQGVLQPGP